MMESDDRGGVVSRRLSRALSAAVADLRRARCVALGECDPETTEWEYAGRRWKWPGGESLPHFWSLCPGERAILEDLAAEFGLDRLAVGTGRIVVALPAETTPEPTVIKLARYGPDAEMGDGRAQNRRERELSAAVDGHPFLPVRDGDPDGDWVAMPRADPLGEGTPGSDGVGDYGGETQAVLSRVERALDDHAGAVHPDELKPENVGQYDGRYWLLDYGRPPGQAVHAAEG